MKRSKIFALSSIASLLLGGCAIGPDYAKPALQIPKEYRNADANKSVVDKKWWTSFGDEGLNTAVESAIAANYDIRVAEAQVEAVLGQFDEAKSYLYPHINGGGSFQRQGVTGSTNSNLKNGVTNTFAASLVMASYEIDLFGKVRRATEAAKAILLASEYNTRAARLSIAAGVAASYTRLSSINAQIEVAKESIKAAAEIEKITKVKYNLGSFSEMEWLQSIAQLESSKAALSALEATKMSEEALFNTLLAENPKTPNISQIDKINAPSVPAGVPSDILTQRPDIGASEQNLIAANAKIGVAKGAYFPSISLTGLLGNQSGELSKLFASPTRIWQFTPSINLPIFSAGLIAGQVKEAEAAKSQALAQYQKTVVSAFNDADSAIGQNYQAKEQMSANKKRAEAMEKAFKSAKLRYELGFISYTDMLTVEQSWLGAKQQEIISKQNAITATINLYKALGGGWNNKDLPDLPSLLPAGR